jgi:hypothetical protein
MGDVRLAIEDAGRTPKSRRRAHEWMRSLAYAVVAILLMASGRLLFRPSQEIEANSVPIPLTSFPGMETDASWSPDGRQVAFTSNGEKGDNEDIYIAQPGSGATLRLTTDPGFDQDPAWSPDGRWIAYAHYNQDRSQYSLQLVSPLGGQLRTLLTNAAPVGRASWAPDGRSLVGRLPGSGHPTAIDLAARGLPWRYRPRGLAGRQGIGVLPEDCMAHRRVVPTGFGPESQPGWRAAPPYEPRLRGRPRLDSRREKDSVRSGSGRRRHLGDRSQRQESAPRFRSPHFCIEASSGETA